MSKQSTIRPPSGDLSTEPKFPRTSKARIRRLNEAAGHPATVELAAIVADLDALDSRICEFLAEHPDGCRCPCCRLTREHEWPNALDALSALRVFVVGLNALTSERPWSRAEIIDMHARAAAMIGADQKGGAS